MKKSIILLAFIALLPLAMNAQNATLAKKVLDKTASVIGRKGGAQANFIASNSKMGSVGGTIAIKGNRFYAHTPKATVWFNGKTQWSYMKSTDEVNVSNPTQAQQMQMNPYTFINIYKTGYTMGVTTKGNSYQVHLTAQNKKRSVQEMYITVSKQSYVPSQVRMRQGKSWTTIKVSNFRAKNLPNSMFTFKSKDYPTAEVIDLR